MRIILTVVFATTIFGTNSSFKVGERVADLSSLITMKLRDDLVLV